MTRWGELIPHDPDDPECQCNWCCEDRISKEETAR